MASILRPSGAVIVIDFQASPSRKIWSPASPSVALTSTIIVASSRRTVFDVAPARELGPEFAAAIP